MKKSMMLSRSLLILGLIMFLAAIPVNAAGHASGSGNDSNVSSAGSQISIAPLNPAFIEYQEELEQGRNPVSVNTNTVTASVLMFSDSVDDPSPNLLKGVSFPEEGELSENIVHPTGLIPSPVDLSHLSLVNIEDLLADEEYGSMYSGIEITGSVSYPSRYDLREEGGVTGVRDQGTAGSCWAHSTIASLESYLVHSESENWDFSENHVKNTLVSSYPNGFDRSSHDDGGNMLMALAYLARWDGPVIESDDPYDDMSPISSSDVVVAKHVQEALILPTVNHTNDLFKWVIMNYGAMTVAINDYQELYFNKENNTFYCYDENAPRNHAVCLVGWDDNFDRNRFTPAAPGDGAYIIKNSWNDNWGDDGYFYISYYDTAIGVDDYVSDDGPRVYTANFMITAENVSNYDRIYQYDPLGWCSNIGNDNSTAVGANIFTATSNETLEAVSFYTVDSNSLYNISIYLDPEDGPINASGPVSVKNGSVSIAGYHTIDLNNNVSLSAGQNFSVVITFTTPTYTYPVAVEKAVSDHSSNAHADAGQSYVSSNGNSWTDISASGMNVCIKAFTKEEKEPEAQFVAVTRYVHVNETVDFHDASLFSPDSWEWDFGDNSTATAQNPSHSYTSPGIYNVSLNVSNGFGSNITTRSSFIRVLNSTITVNGSGTADFTLIKDAIEAASEGDTIIVEPGTYTEMVEIRKDNITIRSSTANPADVQIVSSYPEFMNEKNHAVTILSDNITLQGINVSGGYCGMLVMLSNNCSLIDCSFHDNAYGMVLSKSDNNQIYNCTSNGNMAGIYLPESKDNILKNNSFDDNTVYSCAFDSYSNSVDTSNTVNGKPIYFLAGTTDLIIDSDSNAGLVHLIDCSNITIRDFKSTSEYYGVYLYNTTNSTIENFTCTGDYYGIYLSESADNIISNCTVSSSVEYGISLTGCSSNLIYNNNFNSSNNVEISGVAPNEWNIAMTSGSNIINGTYLGGNFWAKPDGTGWSQTQYSTGNGFCQPYEITDDGNNTDSLPLTGNEEQPGVVENNVQNSNDGIHVRIATSSESPANVAAMDSSVRFVGKDAETHYVFADRDTPVTDISFKAETNVGYVMATVTMLNEAAEDAPAPSSVRVYQSMDIVLGDEDLSSSGINEATIGFAVPKDWISSNNFDKGGIHMEHFSGGVWNRLLTTVTGEDDGYFYFEATTTGFSPFMICADLINDEVISDIQNTGDAGDENDVHAKPGETGENADGSKINSKLLLPPALLLVVAIILTYYKKGDQ